jgi:hypothetical protein
MVPSISENGFTIAQQVAAVSLCENLLSALGPISSAGKRGLLAMPAVAEFARSAHILDLIRPHLPVEPVPVRAIYFDKSPDANWFVGWHQDLTIALRERAEVPGFSLWTVKDGIPHAQPPVECLERILTLRLHLDDAGAENGALRVLPGSHRFGILPSQRIDELTASQPEVLCTASAGDALLMRPLLLHASSRSKSERRRRVLHIEYAGFDLPAPLAWHEAA